MINRQPPRLAAWLMSRLLSGTRSESLIGDLNERYSRGESQRWYWRQTLLAVIAQLAIDARRERFAALRGVIAGFATLISLYHLTLLGYQSTLEAWVQPHTLLYSREFRFWYQYQTPLLALWAATAFLSGWLAARVARSDQRRVGLLTAVLQIPLLAWWSWPMWIAANAQPYSYYTAFPTRVAFVATLAGMPLFTILGTFVASRNAAPRA